MPEVELRFRNPNVQPEPSPFAMTVSMVTTMVAFPRGFIGEAGDFNLGPLHLEVDGAGRYQFEVELDERARLHSGSGKPARIVNGKPYWYWHGVEVTEQIILRPETITVTEIENTDNAEVRRVMVEKYGQTKFLEDCGAKVIQKDSFGQLYEKKFRHKNMWGQRETIKFVRVLNSTPEPDGTFKYYTLRVPPDTRTAKEGVAWTFQIPEKDYQPQQET